MPCHLRPDKFLKSELSSFLYAPREKFSKLSSLWKLPSTLSQKLPLQKFIQQQGLLIHWGVNVGSCSVSAACYSVLQCVAECCSVSAVCRSECMAMRCSVSQCVCVLQRVVVCCSVLQCQCSVLQGVVMCCGVLKCVAVCCSVSAVRCSMLPCQRSVLQCAAVCYSVLRCACSAVQYAAVSVQYVAVYGSVLQRVCWGVRAGGCWLVNYTHTYTNIQTHV